jgi:hypothetical protein
MRQLRHGRTQRQLALLAQQAEAFGGVQLRFVTINYPTSIPPEELLEFIEKGRNCGPVAGKPHGQLHGARGRILMRTSGQTASVSLMEGEPSRESFRYAPCAS